LGSILRRLLSKLDELLRTYESSLEKKLKKILERNGIKLNIKELLKKFDVEYEILSLDTSTIIDSKEKSELIEKLKKIKVLVEKTAKSVLSGYPHNVRVSLKLKTVLAEHVSWSLRDLLSRIEDELRGAKGLESGWRVIADLILDLEEDVYLTVEVDIYVMPFSEII